MINNKKNILVIVIVLLVLALGILLYFYMNNKNDKQYSVVYLQTGEIYVGILHTFPTFTLTDSYLLNTIKDPKDGTSTFQLQPVADALWAPKKLYLSRNQITFYGPLLPTSRVAQTIATRGTK